MSQVWKFILGAREQDVVMPSGAKVLHVAVQRESRCVWCLVNPGNAPTSRRFVVVGTGWTFDPTGLEFIGSMLTENQEFVWHVFERV